jgi:hypothetical protein
MRVCVDSYIICNIKGRSVYFPTRTVWKQVELVLIMVFIDQQFENGFGVLNEANKSTVVTRTFPSYTGCPRRNVQYFGRVFLMLNYISLADTLRYKTRSND